jgi:prepilin-type N-terminal cleavage/methylation domain-containing protein
MRGSRKTGSQSGFSLVEILVVMAMLGLVTMAVYSLYQTTQRTATTQDNVVELQQNLRVAMDRFARDIRMAGFMVSTDPISGATANSLTLRTASAVGRIVRVAEDFSSPANATTEVHVKVASADMVDFFEAGDIVRVLRPPDHSQPIDSTFTVGGKDRDVPEVRLKGFSTPGITYKAGDVIVRTTATTTPHPNTVAYSLSANGELMRAANGGIDEPVANGLTSLNFFYLLDDNTRTDSPAAAVLSTIKAVEIRMTGQAASQEGTKSREIQGVVTIRNR